MKRTRQLAKAFDLRMDLIPPAFTEQKVDHEKDRAEKWVKNVMRALRPGTGRAWQRRGQHEVGEVGEVVRGHW